MKVMVLVPRRELPSTRLRLREPSRYWEREGVRCSFVPVPSGPVDRWEALRLTREHDVVILQKKTSLRSWDLARLVRGNPNLVFDYDDAVMFHELEHGERLSGKHLPKFIRTVSAAKLVVAGNCFLARFARDAGCRVEVLPTPVDAEQYREIPAGSIRREGPVVGWLGVSQNQKYLEPLRAAFGSLHKRFPGLRLKIVSEKFPFDPGIPVERKPWRLEDEPGDIASFDVGIMPLPDNLWAWGKCGYKLIQYLAAGVPVVASPVGLNLDIVREGWNGYFASAPEEWETRIASLLSSPGVAREMGERGRNDVGIRYSIRAYAGEYLRLLRDLHPG